MRAALLVLLPCLLAGQNLTGWGSHRGKDCYRGAGGDPMDPDPYSRSLGLPACLKACGVGCSAVVVRAGGGECYRRSRVQLGECVLDEAWDLYVKETPGGGVAQPDEGWIVKPGLDCYAGQGGTPLQPDPFSLQLEESRCRAACTARPACRGVVTGRAGQCYLRSSLSLPQCVRDPQWTVHLAPGYTGAEEPPREGCQGGVQPYPTSLPNSHYYRQLCTTSSGLRVVSHGLASSAALQRTALLLSKVTATVEASVTRAMTARGFRHALMAAYPRELTTHLPEHSFLDPAFWNERARGLGATLAVPLGSSAEENVLCDGADRYRGEDITVHEFAHSLHLLGLSQVHPSFNSELKQLYAAARASGAWGAGHYAMTDYKEYFAEGFRAISRPTWLTLGPP